MQNRTGYAVQGRIKEGLSRAGTRVFTNVGLFSERMEQPGYFVTVEGMTEPVEVVLCFPTSRQPDTFFGKVVTSL